MGLVILPALIPDIPKIYDVYFSAFKGEPMAEIMLGVLFPGGITPEFRTAHSAHTLSYWHQSTLQYTIKCVDTETNEIIGMALGDAFFQERSEEERKNPGITWLEGKEKERAEKILNPLWEVREKLFGGQRYIYVHVAGVDPKHQGRKAGALLVKWVIELGDNANLPVYFESSPSTVGLYQKMGFERLKESVVHKAEVLGTDTDIEVPLVVKMPSCARGMKLEEWRELGYPAWNEKTAVSEVPKVVPEAASLKEPSVVSEAPMVVVPELVALSEQTLVSEAPKTIEPQVVDLTHRVET